ncbi:restriction endonuclease subunit M [Neomoorella thermoacetica]|nr:N-6 DNA methylase [Moorella thermoacetica]
MYVKAIKHLDPNEEVVKISDNLQQFEYNSAIAVNESIPVPVKDEELVRSLLVVGLHKIYKYPLSKIELEKRVVLGGSRGSSQFSPENDIIVKNSDNDQPYLFIEVKPYYHYFSQMDKHLKDQLFTPAVEVKQFESSKFLVLATVLPPEHEDDFPLRIISIDFEQYRGSSTGAEAFQTWFDEGKPLAFTDIPVNYEKPEVKLLVRGGERDLIENLSLNEITNKWRAIWNLIWGGTIEDNRKFEEFNKILLAKIYDERETSVGQVYTFQIKYIGGEKQTPRQVFSDINKLYKAAFKKYLGRGQSEDNELIGLDEKVLSEDVVFKIVEILEEISIARNVYKNADILAEFYETVIRDAFKQTKGLYLTHPNLVLTLIAGLGIEDLVDYMLAYGNNDYRFRLPFIIDPSCGTGTFLIWIMKYITEYIQRNKTRLASLNEEAESFITNQLPDNAPNLWARDYIYGIEKEAMLATAAQINMILHGDGSSNIFNTDGLLPFEQYKSRISSISLTNLLIKDTVIRKDGMYSKPVLELFDIVVSNPPFSAPVENETLVLSGLELVGKSEILFFERWYQLLKPKGRLGVVLPEAFFSVDEYRKARIFLFSHFNIKAIISLPNFAFSPHTTTLTSLLLAQKKTVEEEKEWLQHWKFYEADFKNKYQQIEVGLKKISKKKKQCNIRQELESLNELCHKLFDGKVRFPVFSDNILDDSNNWSSVKSKIKKAVIDIKEWYILSQISLIVDQPFLNIEPQEIGYKQGKKGSKDRPNQLFTAFDEDNTRILNIQKTNVDIRIDETDLETVIGQIRRFVKWEI